MVYIVFDLDNTIANVASVIFLLQDLTGFHWNSKEILLPPKLKKTLKQAYNLFVKKIANLEQNSNTRIGILRPGIIDVMKFIAKSDTNNGVIIYSNNSSIKCLEFIRDIIHEILGTQNLIKDCIHRTHHLRTVEVNNSSKSWNSLRNLLIKGKCLASEFLEPSEVLFFDDNFHHDLKINLRNNYILVTPYKYGLDWLLIEEIYKSVLEFHHLVNLEFLEIVNKFSLNKSSELSLGAHLSDYKMRYYLLIENLNFKSVPEPDGAIYTMLATLKYHQDIEKSNAQNL